MLNLLINLKKCRNSDNKSTGSLLVFMAFIAGSVLFWLLGAELYISDIFDFSLKNFCVAFSATILLIALSSFSQLGPIQIAVGDAAFEFVVCCFALSELNQCITFKSVLSLCLKIFAIIFFAMLLSQRANTSSIHILSKVTSDKKLLNDFLVNLAIIICLILILLIICLNAL